MGCREGDRGNVDGAELSFAGGGGGGNEAIVGATLAKAELELAEPSGGSKSTGKFPDDGALASQGIEADER
jgi:hypothetical protein